MTVAYEDQDFLATASARPLRILSEYLEPLDHFRREKVHDTIVFFGSARLPEGSPYYADARELARLITEWSGGLPTSERRFVVCTGGGPGIMEAANRGAADAGGKSVGLNIGLSHEQRPNPFIPPELLFEFHYFFMRKFWFSYLARALVVFPGGFGTLDELTELLTLVQTQKLERKILIVLYGEAFWRKVLGFDALLEHGMISASDLELFVYADTPAVAFAKLRSYCERHHHPEEVTAETPAIAPTRLATDGRSR